MVPRTHSGFRYLAMVRGSPLRYVLSRQIDSHSKIFATWRLCCSTPRFPFPPKKSSKSQQKRVFCHKTTFVSSLHFLYTLKCVRGGERMGLACIRRRLAVGKSRAHARRNGREGALERLTRRQPQHACARALPIQFNKQKSEMRPSPFQAILAA